MKSLARLNASDIAVPAALPLLGEFLVRPATQIVDRIICLNAVTAAAFGFSADRAFAWLSQEDMVEHLTGCERSFLTGGTGDASKFQLQVEAIWALAWLVNIAPVLDFWRDCNPSFVSMLPDLKQAESSSKLRARARLRTPMEIGPEIDIAYCLHWAIRDAEIKGGQLPRGITPYVIIERRRALEWATGTDGWDDTSLDT